MQIPSTSSPPESRKRTGRVLFLALAGIEGFRWGAVTVAPLCIGLSRGEWRGNAKRDSQQHCGRPSGWIECHKKSSVVLLKC